MRWAIALVFTVSLLVGAVSSGGGFPKTRKKSGGRFRMRAVFSPSPISGEVYRNVFFAGVYLGIYRYFRKKKMRSFLVRQ